MFASECWWRPNFGVATNILCTSGRIWTCLNLRLEHWRPKLLPWGFIHDICQKAQLNKTVLQRGLDRCYTIGVVYSRVPLEVKVSTMREMLFKAPAECLYGCFCPVLSTEFVARQEWFTVNPELSFKFFPLAIPSLTFAYCQIVIPNWCPTIDREFLELCFVKRLWNVCDGQKRFRCSAFKSSSVVKVLGRLSPPFRTCVRRTSLPCEGINVNQWYVKKPSKIRLFWPFWRNPVEKGWSGAKSDLLKPLSYKGLLAFWPENTIFLPVVLDAPEIVLFALFWCVLGYLLKNKQKPYINKAFLQFSILKNQCSETVLHPQGISHDYRCSVHLCSIPVRKSIDVYW